MLPRLAAALAGFLLAAPPPAAAQDPGVVDDVPYLETPQIVVDEMLRIAQVGPKDVVYDLGSGDGRVVITAAKKFGARGVGIEIDPARVALSRTRAQQAGVAERVRFLKQDIFASDLREATVVTLYLAPHLNLRLRDTLLGLAPGTRIVSHSAGLGDWRPDARTAIRKDVLLWVVPASVAGRWQARIGSGAGELALEIEFRQKFQELAAAARLQGEPASVWETTLRGDRLSFVVVNDRADTSLYLTGRVSGGTITGEASRDVGAARSTLAWQAVRESRGRR
jgi:SAM-dependent methyltransferase